MDQRKTILKSQVQAYYNSKYIEQQACSQEKGISFPFNFYTLNFMTFCFQTQKVLVTQSCQTSCNPRTEAPPGSSVHGILQARILEWVAISFSRESSWPGIECSFPAF